MTRCVAGAGVQAAEGVHERDAEPQQLQGSPTYYLFRVDFLFRVDLIKHYFMAGAGVQVILDAGHQPCFRHTISRPRHVLSSTGHVPPQMTQVYTTHAQVPGFRPPKAFSNSMLDMARALSSLREAEAQKLDEVRTPNRKYSGLAWTTQKTAEIFLNNDWVLLPGVYWSHYPEYPGLR